MIEVQEMDKTPIAGLWQLPKGWEWMCLGDAFSLRSGTHDPSRTPNEIFSLYSMPSYDAGIGPEILYGREIGSSKIVVQRGDILLSKLNPRIPRIWYINEDNARRKLASTDFLSLVVRQNSNGEPFFDTIFARYLLLSNIFRSQISQEIKGATNSRQRLNREDILSALLPRPRSLDIQHRIVARIEALLADLREAQKTLASMQNDIDPVMNSALREVLDELSKNYSTSETIGRLISNKTIKIIGGGTPPTGDERYWEGSIPWVTPKDMKRWYIDDTEDHVTSLALAEKRVKLIPPGSVLVVVRGMILARHLPIGITTNEVTTNQDMKALYCVNDLLPEYLGYVLRANEPSLLQQVEVAAHGTRRLETAKLENVSIPLVPEKQQRRVIAYLNSVQESASVLQATLQEDNEILQQIEQSILDQAFRGEL